MASLGLAQPAATKPALLPGSVIRPLDELGHDHFPVTPFHSPNPHDSVLNAWHGTVYLKDALCAAMMFIMPVLVALKMRSPILLTAIALCPALMSEEYLLWRVPDQIVACLARSPPQAKSELILDSGRNPYYLRGDFDGDGSPAG